MRYQVIGEDRTSGARRVVTLEAESKGAVEKKARNMGLNVRSVRDVSESMETTPVVYGRGRGRGGGWRLLVLTVVALLIVYVVWAYVWPRLVGV